MRAGLASAALALTAALAGCECGAPLGVACETDADCSLNSRCDPGFGLCVSPVSVPDAGPLADGGQDSGPRDGGIDAGLADSGPADAGPDSGPTDGGVRTVIITGPSPATIFGAGPVAVLISAPIPEAGSTVTVRARQGGVVVQSATAASPGGSSYQAQIDSRLPSILSGDLELTATFQSGSGKIDSAPVHVWIDKAPPSIELEVIPIDRSSVTDLSLRVYLTDRFRRVENVTIRATVVDAVAGVDPANVRLVAAGRAPQVAQSQTAGVYRWEFPAAELDMSTRSEAAVRVNIEARDVVGNLGTAITEVEVTRVRWWFDTGGQVQGAAAVHRGNDGAVTVIVPSDSAVVAVKDVGTFPQRRWRQPSAAAGRTFRASPPSGELGPALADEALYIPDTGGKIYVLDPATGIQLGFRDLHGTPTMAALGDFTGQKRRIFVGDGGLVYEADCVGCGHMHALDANFAGNLVSVAEASTDSTRSHPGGINGPAVVSALRNVFHTGRARGLFPGDQKWLLILRNSTLGLSANYSTLSDDTLSPLTSSPAMLSRPPNSRLFTGTNVGAVAALSGDAQVLNWCGGWAYSNVIDCGLSANVFGTPIIGYPVANDPQDGYRVFFVAGDGSIYGRVATDDGFTSRGWRAQLGAGGVLPNRATPALGAAIAGSAEGVLYVPGTHGRLQALDAATGSTLWSFPDPGAPLPSPTPSASYASPSIWCDGTLFYGANDNRLYAITIDSRTLAPTPWPKFRHDARNSGSLAFPLESNPGACP